MTKLLIAVGSKAVCTALEELLSRYEVHICHTGTDALTLLESIQPEVLLLDLNLPKMDGLTVLRKTRYKPPAILALTNLATSQVLQEAVKAGIQELILTPYRLRYVWETLEAMLEKVPSPDR